MTTMHRYSHRATLAAKPLTVAQVAAAYNFPADLNGKGRTVALIELGGGYDQTDWPNVVPVSVAGGSNSPDGVDGADGEVQLDISVVRQAAPGATVRVYFAPNSDAGFLAAVQKATADLEPRDAISISWGQAENQWDRTLITGKFHDAFAAAVAKGIGVYAAAGDSGSDDSTKEPVTDYPAADPSVVGCGGTRLTVTSSGARAAEVTWDDNDISSATGGGLSKVFPGRCVPDVAGNADPDTGYEVTVDGEDMVIGGTSAVAPLMAAMHVVLGEAASAPFSLLKLVPENPTVCYDVTIGDNGAYRAGLGRDQVTGFGVPDASKLRAYIPTGAVTPPPVEPPAPVDPPPTSPPAAGTVTVQMDADQAASVYRWVQSPHLWHVATVAAKVLRAVWPK